MFPPEFTLRNSKGGRDAGRGKGLNYKPLLNSRALLMRAITFSFPRVIMT